MNNEKNIMLKFIIWCLFGLSIVIAGITNIFADTYDAYLFKAQLYDNSNGSLSTVTTNFSNNYWTGTIPYMSANTSGAAWGISSPIPLVANHTYAITVFISHEYGNTVLSTYNRIGVGSSFNEAKTSYQNNSNCNEVLSKTQLLVYGQGLQFAFTPTVNANYIVFPFATSLSGSNVKFDLNNITIDDLGTSGVSETTINNSLNNQTNIINGTIASSESNIKNNDNANRDTIINNQNSNKQAIIDNQNANNEALIDSNTQNTQDIIDNQNANNQKILDDNKKSFQTCRDSVNLFNSSAFESNLKVNKIINNDGIEVNDSTSSYSTYTIQVEAGKLYSINGYFQRVYFLNSNKEFVSRIIYNSSTTLPMNSTYKPNENGYFQFQIRDSTYNSNKGKEQVQEGIFTEYEPYGEDICVSKLDEQNKTSKGILGKLGDLITNLFDTSGPDTEDIEGMAGWLPAGPVDSILNLPLTFLNNITTGLNSTCRSVEAPLPFVNKNLTLPCFSTIITSINGANTVWTFVGVTASVLILYYYLKNLYKWIDKKLSMDEDTDWGGI